MARDGTMTMVMGAERDDEEKRPKRRAIVCFFCSKLFYFSFINTSPFRYRLNYGQLRYGMQQEMSWAAIYRMFFFFLFHSPYFSLKHFFRYLLNCWQLRHRVGAMVMEEMTRIYSGPWKYFCSLSYFLSLERKSRRNESIGTLGK